jgi:hypothetical protein
VHRFARQRWPERNVRSFPIFVDWADQFPPFFAARSLLSQHPIRVEDKIENGR